MTKTKTTLLWVIAVFLFVTWGCAYITSGGEKPAEEDVIATSVAETLAAGIKTPGAPLVVPTLTGEAPAPAAPTSPAAATSEPPAPPAAAGELLVAYVDTSRNLWVWQEGGEPRQLTSSADVLTAQVSADGRWIAFTRSSDSLHESLWVIRSDGSGEQAIMDQEAFEAMPRGESAVTSRPFYFNWTPGSSTLAFTTSPVYEGLGLSLNEDLWLADVESGSVEELLEPGEGGMFYYSPDGRQIALVKPDSISLIDADGSNRRDKVISYPIVSTYSEYFYYATPQWAEDSSYLRVVIPAPAALERPEETTNVWHIPADGSPAEQVGSVVTAPLFFPALSPDLAQLAYVRQVGDAAENRRELHIYQIDTGGDTTYLTEAHLIFAAWAADSSRFAFTTGENNRPYLGQIGETPQALTDTPSAFQIQWVDSDRFLFVSPSSPGFELRLGVIGSASALIATTENPLSFDFTGE